MRPGDLGSAKTARWLSPSGWAVRNSAATVASGTWSSRARAFMAIIDRASIRSSEQGLQRGVCAGNPSVQVGAENEHRPVLGEVVPVVLQDPEPLGLDLRVGGVEVHHVQRSARSPR